MMVMILALSLSYRCHSSGSHPSSAALVIVLNMAFFLLIAPKHLRSAYDDLSIYFHLSLSLSLLHILSLVWGKVVSDLSICFHLSLSLWDDRGILGELKMENQDQREPAANAADDFKKICWGVITLLCSILRTYDPLVTHYPKMVAFIVTIVIYFSLSLAEFVFRNNGINHVIVTKLNLFVGVLAVILPLLIIVPAVGWLALGMWVCVFGIFVCCSYDEIGRGFVDIYEELMEELRNDDEDEEEPNGMLDENLPV